ncbi:MAG: trimethylamine methyltransferase family protein, partial [Eubacterium sp.]
MIGGKNRVLRPLGSNIYIQTGSEIRKMTNEDILNQFKLGDTSPVISGSHINLLADHQNFTQEQKIFANMALQMRYANKPTVTLYPNTLSSGKDSDLRKLFKETIEIVNRFEGNDKYHILPMLNSLSPLTFDNGPLEKLFATCEANQPLWIIPCAMPLMTAPPSVAAMMAMTNAEQLAGILLAQLLRPGLPVIYGNTSASTNMHTIQLSIGSPETALVCYATAGLADYYNLPFRTGGSLSDAKDFDAQAGVESTMMLYASLDCGANFIEHACGTLGTFNVINFEKFLLDEEIIEMTSHLLEGINCSDDHFCFEEIKKTGPRGTFLKGRTPKMYREEFFMNKY